MVPPESTFKGIVSGITGQFCIINRSSYGIESATYCDGEDVGMIHVQDGSRPQAEFAIDIDITIGSEGGTFADDQLPGICVQDVFGRNNRSRCCLHYSEIGGIAFVYIYIIEGFSADCPIVGCGGIVEVYCTATFFKGSQAHIVTQFLPTLMMAEALLAVSLPPLISTSLPTLRV